MGLYHDSIQCTANPHTETFSFSTLSISGRLIGDVDVLTEYKQFALIKFACHFNNSVVHS